MTFSSSPILLECRSKPKVYSGFCPPLHHAEQSGGLPRRRRAHLGVFGAQAHSGALSTENAEVGPYPKRVTVALSRRRSGPPEHHLELGAPHVDRGVARRERDLPVLHHLVLEPHQEAVVARGR